MTIDVYDVLGARVARLINETLTAGQHFVRWSGGDAAGRPVANGIYYVQMRAPGFNGTRKAVMLR